MGLQRRWHAALRGRLDEAREILLDDDDPEEAAIIRFWCSRSQARALARWGVDVVKRGRPLCPQCGQPIEPEGHFCPKKNGYRR